MSLTATLRAHEGSCPAVAAPRSGFWKLRPWPLLPVCTSSGRTPPDHTSEGSSCGTEGQPRKLWNLAEKSLPSIFSDTQLPWGHLGTFDKRRNLENFFAGKGNLMIRHKCVATVLCAETLEGRQERQVM